MPASRPPSRARVPSAAAIIGALWLLPLACSGSSTRSWSYSVEAGTIDQIHVAQRAVDALRTEIGPDGWMMAGRNTMSEVSPSGATISSTTQRHRWQGNAFGLKRLTIEVSERDRPADGPEITVSITGPVPGPDAENRFRLLEAHVSDMFRKTLDSSH